MFSERGQFELKWALYALVAVFAVFVVISISSGFIMNYYWFKSVGYLQIFMVNLRYQLLLLFVGWIVTTLALLFAWRTIDKSLDKALPPISVKLYKILSVFVGLGVGWWFKGKYLVVLKYLNHASWGVSDPVFGNDVSFYVFSLPMIRTVLTFVMVVSLLVLFFTLFFYGVGRLWISEEMSEEYLAGEPPFWDVHRFLKSWPILGSVVSLTAVGVVTVWLSRYSYLWGFNPGSSVPTEASYMAIKYNIPYTWVLAVGAGLLGALVVYVFLNSRELREKLEFEGFLALKREIAVVGLIIVIFLVIPGVVFGAIDSINVMPNEPDIQRPYLERTINFTNRAYDLDDMMETQFSFGQGDLTSDEALDSPTIKNARIVDYRPIYQSYQERQRLRTYYEFHDVDVDRYMSGDEKKLAVISGREIDIAEVPTEGGEWQNKHLIYTHGYGAVLSPASEVETDGSPVLSVSDIPIDSNWTGLQVNEPRIYYGERTNTYALVGAEDLDEFDYPKGEESAYNRYDYGGGISLGSAWKKMIAWFYTGDFNLLVSDYVGDESELLLHRNVHSRAQKIAPFLRYDSNAQFFVDDGGRLVYLLNGITHAEHYPYSYSDGSAPGYLSDSVKAFVDAASGEVEFYPIKDDPIVETYSRIYPDLFMDTEMPEGYRDHIIYPQDLFSTQMEIYRRYHMTDYRTFYQQEDLWTFANEIYHGSTKRVEAYNIIYDVRDVQGFEDHEEEFMLVKPFTPKGKNNMIAWVGIGQDGNNYGRKLILNFPKGEFVRGPMQVESIIDQETDISEQFSLWGQRGSNVLRGNLLVLPVEEDLLYLEPIYLSATGIAYPQLKRVVAVYRDEAVMENSLERSIRAVLGEEVAPTPPGPGDNVAPAELVELVAEYLELREDYNQLISQGKYAEAGVVRERMEAIAENMRNFVP